MSTPVIPRRWAPDAGSPRPRHRRWVWIALPALVALVAVAWLVLVVTELHGQSRPIPSFPSLIQNPDSSLHGTVAYTDSESRCVRIVAAAGGPSKDVLCLGPQKLDPKTAAVVGKEMSLPQLVWRSDGRLEVTMMLMRGGGPGKPPVHFVPEWQKTVDVTTGAVQDVPAADLPSGPNLSTQPATNPAGQRLAWTSDGDGRVKVTLTDPSGSRTLLSARGPGEYTYALHRVFWAPDSQWIAADDGRILVITPGSDPVTRVLVDGGGGASDYPLFAVTDRHMMEGAAPALAN